MRLKLSIDVWRDVFDFLGPTERKHLALISEIGDREFCDFCQKWLHEWTKNVQLGELLISPPPTTKWVRIGGRLERDDEVKLAILQRLATQTSLWIPRRKIPVPFAELEIPENIQGFEEIELSYLDSTALQFLRRMQSLFHDVYLSVSCREEELEATRTVIDHLLPLLTGGIERVCLEGMHTTQFLLNLRDRFHCPTQFLSIKRIDVFMQKEKHESVDQLIGLFLPWLSTGRADGQPRTLIMQLFKGNTLEFIDRIRQAFLNAACSSSFFIWLFRRGLGPLEDIPESTTQNVRTGEQLVIRERGVNVHLIGRCPAELDGQKWVEEKDRNFFEANEQITRRIKIYHPTLGPLEELTAEVGEEAAGKEDQQPGPSSKKPKLI